MPAADRTESRREAMRNDNEDEPKITSDRLVATSDRVLVAV
jgi:hypothetical protein